MENYKAKFMCSYGGEIQPRTDDNKLSYIGGNNRILYVHRNIKFADMLAKLSALFNSADDVSFKYQFPGEGFDALISVTDDDDLDNMMLEYDQLYRASATAALLRLFLFPNSPPSHTLNSGPTSVQLDPVKPNANVDFLFSLDNGAGVPLPPTAVKSLDLEPAPVAPPPGYQSRVAVSTSDRVVASDPNVNHPLEGIDEDGIDDYDDYDDDEESEANTVDYDDYDDDEESERNTLGFVDKPMNQWSLQSQFVPSKAGVPVFAPTEKESTFHTPWGTSKHMAGCAAASSRLIGPLPATKYDVFISFRGEDTRTNFTCHLHEALDRKQIKTFIDYELHKGDEISPSLFRAIENAYVSVVVFSENYASSKWCLEELVKILECRENQRQVVIPVFYEIDPSYVRKQNGSYKKAFENHLKNSVLNKKKVQIWKDALAEAADLAGWDSHSRSYRDDSELIQKIVEDVLQKLIHHYPPNDFKRLVGIQQNVVPLESLLREARSVGIWGIGGIGKTTIAKYIFDKYSHQYEGSCFLENVRERSGDHGQGLHDLCDQLHSELLNEKIRQNSTSKSTFPKCRLHRQRNFIILDDVSSSMQLECLLGELQSYGSNTKIIITTRDKSVLENRRVETIYEMEGLGFQESLTLFNLSAFNEDSPEEYKELSRKAVAYCKGVPLALIVLGSFLHSKSEVEWDSALKKLEKIPHEEIQNVLKLSYDGLNYEEQQIFLDVACFFKGEPKENVVNLLDSCNFYPVIGLRSLHDKALITIFGNIVWMHDLIQQMGWEIVRRESTKNPGNRSRLWDIDDVCDVLKNNKGSDAIQGIMFDMSQSGRDLCLSADTFKKMSNLRYLKFFISHWNCRFCDLQLPMGLESLSGELRCLEWYAYPLQTLPSNFCPEKLVTLCMPCGQFKRLWSGVQNLVNLKEINLAGCNKLMELPDFSKAQNLKLINLSRCGSLRHVHSSILSLGMLEVLNLIGCKKLKMLESETHLRSLVVLSVLHCSSLKKLSLSLEKPVFLDFKTAVKVSYLSIGCLNRVRVMEVDGSRLENLPTEWGCLKSLLTLGLYNFSRVISKQTLHLLFDGLQSLENLTLQCCHGLFELLDNVNCLSSLQKLRVDEINVERLPDSIKHLSGLQTLSLHNCKRLLSLPELPSSVDNLQVVKCPLLQSLPELPSSIDRLKVVNCPLLQSLPELPSSIYRLKVVNCPLLQSLPKLPSSINRLKVVNCPLLQSLPELPSSIVILKVVNCPLLQSLPKLPSSINRLNVVNCPLLQSLPKLPSSIYRLKVANCPLLQSLPELPSHPLLF